MAPKKRVAKAQSKTASAQKKKGKESDLSHDMISQQRNEESKSEDSLSIVGEEEDK